MDTDLYQFASDGKLTWGRLFSDMQCESIISQIKSRGNIDRGMYLPGSTPIATYRFDAATIEIEPGLLLHDAVWSAFSACNHLALDVDDIDVVLMLEYQPGTYLAPHADWSPDIAPHRKLSLTVQLSDADAYSGGDVVIQRFGSHTGSFGQDLFVAPKRRGMCIVWPAWTVHWVTPLGAGTRYSLVAWAKGPNFR